MYFKILQKLINTKKINNKLVFFVRKNFSSSLEFCDTVILATDHDYLITKRF